MAIRNTCPAAVSGWLSKGTRQPLRVAGEVLDWEGHSPEVVQGMRDHLEELKQRGIEAIND
jgi:rifampin ADP-ribosylating transferase